jgi:hypothetical protein
VLGCSTQQIVNMKAVLLVDVNFRILFELSTCFIALMIFFVNRIKRDVYMRSTLQFLHVTVSAAFCMERVNNGFKC